MTTSLRAEPRQSGIGRRPRGLALVAALVLAALPGTARADDQRKAEELFDQGRKLMRSRATLDKACETLEESLKLWDRGDTVLNLALCHRLQGKTATAWAEFDRAITHGIKVRFPEAIVEAEKQRAELSAMLSKLTVTVPATTAALGGLRVELAGQALPKERWNKALAIDPGRVRVTAQADGYKPFEVNLDIGPSRDTRTVVVVLEVEPPPKPPAPPVQPPPAVAQPRPVWPWIVGGAGLALGAGAIVSEIIAMKARAELSAQCGPRRDACPVDYDFGPARTRELVGFGLFVGLGVSSVAALGAAGTGLALSWRAPGRSVSLTMAPTSIGVAGSF